MTTIEQAHEIIARHERIMRGESEVIEGMRADVAAAESATRGWKRMGADTWEPYYVRNLDGTLWVIRDLRKVIEPGTYMAEAPWVAVSMGDYLRAADIEDSCFTLREAKAAARQMHDYPPLFAN